MILTLPYGAFEILDADERTFASSTEEGFWDLDLKPYLDKARAGSHCVDVGAHVGLYSGYWAATGMRVTAVEGHPSYTPPLCRNIDRNRWESVVLVLPWFAYSRVCQLQEKADHPTPASNTWLPVEEGELAFPLDDYARLIHQPVDFLKIDTQGADLHVLLGAEKIVERDRPLILIEYEEALTKLHGHTADDYHQWAVDHRYREHPINGWNCFWEPE